MYKGENDSQIGNNGWALIPSWLEKGEPDRFDLPNGEVTLFIPSHAQRGSACEPTLREGKTLVVDTARAMLVDEKIKPTSGEGLKRGYEQDGYTVVLYKPRRIVAVKNLGA